MMAGLSLSSMALQRPFDSAETWTAILSNTWDVLGPFPISAREQHFLSPAFPLNLLEPLNLNATWPSAYADGGRVAWSQFQSDPNGTLKVSYPDIRWSNLRATEGWAALQFHSVLRSTLKIHPPVGSSAPHAPPKLRVKLTQGSFFTVVSSSNISGADSLRWYTGNIYDLEQAPTQIVELPSLPSASSTTEYVIYVSGDYEIRLFGDPRTYSGDDTPVLTVKMQVETDGALKGIARDSKQDVVCDFVDGFAFGDAVGFGLRSSDGWWTVKSAALSSPIDGLTLDMLHEVRLAPTQTRTVPLRIHQSKPLLAQLQQMIVLVTAVSEEGMTEHLEIMLHFRHLSKWNNQTAEAIKASYFFAESMPTTFLTLPPKEPSCETFQPPILALHGAGVKILEHDFWAKSLPQQHKSWLVMPSGRTSWGLDWHGPSSEEAWASVDALADITNGNSQWRLWSFSRGSPVIIMGHSNGGQGAWHLSSRYPDRVLGVVPAAGYIKSQSYVSLQMARSGRFIDPLLRAILDTALTADDNDLFMSNLVDTPILAIHGGVDDNVPAWHSRELVDVLQTWNPRANITYHEIPGQPHWWPSVLNTEDVQAFINSISNCASIRKARSSTFTLTVSIPSESGSFHGWKIESLQIPGRLGRLQVEVLGGVVSVRTTNVHTFSLDLGVYEVNQIVLNGEQITLPSTAGIARFPKDNDHKNCQLSGRMQKILSSVAPLVLVVSDQPSSHTLSIALRIAHDLHTYHKLDSEIWRSSEAAHRAEANRLGNGNIVILGDVSPTFTEWCLSRISSAFETMPQGLREIVSSPGSEKGIMSLLPHPVNSYANMLWIKGDMPALEIARRLFPIRTGVPVPDWIVIESRMDRIGAAGISAAGLWGHGWKWDDRWSVY